MRAQNALLPSSWHQDLDDQCQSKPIAETKNMCLPCHQRPSAGKFKQSDDSFSTTISGTSFFSHQQHQPNGLCSLCSPFFGDEDSVCYSNELHSLCQKGQLDMALAVLARASKTLPTHIYVSLLKLCCKNNARNQVKQLYAHLVQSNVQLTGFLGDYVVMSLAMCGAIEDACQLSSALSHLTVFSWTALISAKIASGSGQEALQMFKIMREKGIEPTSYTFISLFKACGITRNVEQGKKLHEIAYKNGFALDLFVHSALICMYRKCGAIVEAEKVFSSSCHSDVVSWNAMLGAYVEQGQGEKALQAYRQMQEESVKPDQLTFVLALQACGVIAENGEVFATRGGSNRVLFLQIGRALHADARRVAPSTFVHNALISMYGKCGAVLEAEHVFDALSQCSTVSWNAMLAVYVQEGHCEKALMLYEEMLHRGNIPAHRTFLFAIQACGNLAEKEAAFGAEGQSIKMTALKIGQALHLDARRNNFESNTFVGTSLLSMYGKCGALREAEGMFVTLSERDEVSCNAMLSAYIENGQGEKALKLIRQMHEEIWRPGKVSIMLALQACSILVDKEENSVEAVERIRVLSLEIVESLHADARKRRFALDAHMGSTLVSVYGKFGAVVKAANVFTTLPHRDVVLWSVMLSAYIEQGRGDMALQLYQQMLKEGVTIDQHALVFALQACATLVEKEIAMVAKESATNLVVLEVGQVLHAEARSKGFTSNTYVGNALVSMYGKCGGFVEAKDAFNTISQRNTTSWNAMLSAYVEHGHEGEALWLYKQMQQENPSLDDVTLVCVLQACRLAGSLEICYQLQFIITSAGYEEVLSVAACSIHAFGNCASMADAQALLDQLFKADLVSWNACCDSYSVEGDCLGSLCMLESLKLSGTKPDEVTFISILTVCTRTGFVSEGLKYYEQMGREYGIAPNLKHYVTLMDLLGRAGDFTKVEDMLKRMPMQGSLAMWLCLLGACCTHGNIELAKHAFDHAVTLQPKQSTAYIVMSNMYIEAGLQWSRMEVETLRHKYGACETCLEMY